MKRSDKRRGLATLCIGGGQGAGNGVRAIRETDVGSLRFNVSMNFVDFFPTQPMANLTKLLGDYIYLAGRIKFELLFHGPLAE